MGIYCKSVAIILILFLYVFIGENGNLGHKSQQWLYDFVLLGGLIGTATANKDGLMPAGQVFTNPDRALNAGQVCLLSTSRYVIAFNIIVWHSWRGIASYHILLSNDSSKAIYKVIALSNLSSQKFYVTISDDKTISIYLKNNSEGPMNLSIQPVTSFKTTPVIATLPEDAIEVVVE